VEITLDITAHSILKLYFVAFLTIYDVLGRAQVFGVKQHEQSALFVCVFPFHFANSKPLSYRVERT
jgi:hypothetical protein